MVILIQGVPYGTTGAETIEYVSNCIVERPAPHINAGGDIVRPIVKAIEVGGNYLPRYYGTE
jgi:hypothetical protein